MQKQVDNIEVKVDKLYAALVGDDLNPNGFVKRMEKLEKYQSIDRKQKYMFVGAAAVLGFLFNLWGKI